MASEDRALRTEARFPGVAQGAGHYESFYIKASRPGGGRSVWIRHTIHKPPGEQPSGSLWFTLFDAEAPGPRATKGTFPGTQLDVPAGAYLRLGTALLEPGAARGAIEAEAGGASWDLAYTEGPDALRHLPYDFLYRSRLPKTKLLSPYPDARFSGHVEIGGERFDLDAWPGMVGHNWGAEHAERWVWIQAHNLGGVEGDYLDVAAGRIKIGRTTTPWVANGRLVLDGEEHALGGLDKIYGTDLDETPTDCEFTVPGKGVNVKGRVSAAPKDFVGWVYADPAGPEHNAVNCSISDIDLKVERPGRKHARVEAAGVAAYELGMRETDHGIPLQPFPDG